MRVLSGQIEQSNQNDVLHCIGRGDEVSRASVAKQLGLSRTTVSTVAARLIDLGLVRETIQTDPAQNRGRPGIPLCLTKDVWYAAGASFIDQELLFVLTDLAGGIVCRHVVPVADPSADVFLDKLVEGFSAVIARCPGRLLPMLGVGSPGMINHGCVLRASDMGWVDVPIAQRLEQMLGYPSVVVNRHWASCLSEYHFGAGKGIKSQIYVGISTGIAASIILDGHLFTGSHHSAGEIGHTVVKRNGRQCNCGSHGCLHTVASEIALLQHVGEHYAAHRGPVTGADALWEKISSGQTLLIGDVCAAAFKGNPVALGELQTAALYLGLSIGNLISMFNPQCVILGGSLIDHGGDLFTNMIISSVRAHASADALVGVQIRPWMLSRYSGALGAALLVLERKLDLAADSAAASAALLAR